MVRLGIPAGGTLARRLAWLIALRLLFLALTLAIIGSFYLRDEFNFASFTVRLALLTLVVSFALAGLYAVLLRRGRSLDRLANAQLVSDPLVWTIIVYVSGGASSGATSFYGLSCLVGAILTGLRGATLAAVVGGVCYGSLVASIESGWLRPPPDQPASLYQLTPSELSYYVLVNLLVLVVVALLAGNLAERLRIAGGELIEAKQRAEQAERMAALGRLAAGLAHEIRNPLGSIAGSVQLLRTGPGLSEEDRKLCEIVQRETARLNDLVTDMLDLSRPRQPNFTIVDTASVAREVVELTTKSGRAATDVAVTYSGPRHAYVRADGAQLYQLIWNLVRNAVQASSAGDEVSVCVVPTADGQVQLTVADHGIGIDEQSMARLFDAFFTTRSHGTGVGLAVVKRIADQHGFEIDVHSAEGKGAVFRVRLGRAMELTPRDSEATVAPTP
jgi:signal transduction histidine kinase